MNKLFCIFILFSLQKITYSQCINGDCKDGHGKYITPWLDKYVGEWKNGLMHGQGSYSFANGDEYIGNFENGLRNGQGIYIKVDGERLTGKWENNQFIGNSEEYNFNCANGNCKNGLGESKNLKGDHYKGTFVDGLLRSNVNSR